MDSIGNSARPGPSVFGFRACFGFRFSDFELLNMPIVVLGLNHRSSPIAVRERFAFAEARVPAALQLLRDSGAADEAVILSTCNRVEIYAATTVEPRQAFVSMYEFLVTCHDYRDPLTDEIYKLHEPQSVE